MSGIKITTPITGGSEIVLLKEEQDKLKLINTDRGEPSGFVHKYPSTMGAIELSPDGTIIYKINYDGTFTKTTSGLFAEGTAYETTAVAQTTCIYPAIAGGFDIYINATKHNIQELKQATYNPASGLQFCYFDSNAELQTSPVFDGEYFEETPIVSIVYGNITTGRKVLFGDERHGIVMDGAMHEYLHFSEGTRYRHGLSIEGLAIGLGTYTQTSAGLLADEDKKINIATFSDNPFWSISGTAWDGTELFDNNLALMGATYPYYNEKVGESYQLTEIGNNNYTLVHFLATNDAERPVVKVVGQNVYNSVSDAQTGILTEASNLVLAGLPTPEFHFIGSIIIDSNGTLRALDDGSLYYDLRTTTVTGSGTTPTGFGLISGKVYLSANQVFADKANEKVNFDTVSVSGIAWNNTNKCFTVNSSGVYLIQCSLIVSNAGVDQESLNGFIYKNVSTIVARVGIRFSGTGTLQDTKLSEIINLTNGDTIQLNVYQSTGGDIELRNTEPYTNLSITKIS